MKPRARCIPIAAAMTLLMTCGIASRTPASSIFQAAGIGTNANLNAEAVFNIVGGNLQVTLTNTSPEDVTVDSQVLGAVFFDVSGGSYLTANSASLFGGSSVYTVGDSPTPVPGVDIADHWVFKGGLANAPASYGISAVGYGLFGKFNTFSGNEIQPNGIDYGLTSAGDDITTSNPGLKGIPLVQNSAVFTLGNLPADFNLSQISNVHFQYGSSLLDPNVPAVPEPAFMQLGAMLLLSGIGAGLRRRRAA